jgi:hypothetical protein
MVERSGGVYEGIADDLAALDEEECEPEELSLEAEEPAFEDDDDFLGEGEPFLPALASLAPVVARAAPKVLSALGSLLGETGPEEEAGEAEEDEDEPVPGLTRSNNMLAEILAAEAAESVSEAAAQAKVGAATAAIASGAPGQVKKVTPTLVTQAAKMAHALRRVPGGKKLNPLVNEVTRRAVRELARKSKRGELVTKAAARQAVVRQARKVLKPKPATATLKRHAATRRSIDLRAVSRAERFY